VLDRDDGPLFAASGGQAGVPILGQPVNAGALGGIMLAALGVVMVTWRLAEPDRTGQSTRPAKESHQPDHVPAAEHA